MMGIRTEKPFPLNRPVSSFAPAPWKTSGTGTTSSSNQPRKARRGDNRRLSE